MITYDLFGSHVKSIGWSDFIDPGRAGPYNAILPCDVNDMNDVVAHYDELVRYFATWPDGQTWGKAKPGKYGKVVYCIRPVDQPRPKDPAISP